MSDVKWGVLSTAKIGLQKVIPGIQNSQGSQVYALASRDEAAAREAAENAGIPVAHGSYEALLSDPSVEAVYIPLPNHMHAEWSVKALEAGKHVLCEKPLALSTEELERMAEASRRSGKILAEAFMVGYHPQWLTARRIVREGTIGKIRAVQGIFSYYNADEKNIRNIPAYGGGGLLDIGCYPIFTSRLLFGEEPLRVCAALEKDPQLGIDRLASVIMEFPSGQASFISATQMVPSQRMSVFGTEGRLEVEIPFNAPPDQRCRLYLSKGEFYQDQWELLDFDLCDQYGLQAEALAGAIRGGDAAPVSLENSRGNRRVLDAVFRAAASGRWESVEG